MHVQREGVRPPGGGGVEQVGEGGTLAALHFGQNRAQARRRRFNKRLAQQAGDVYTFVLFNVMESTALLHLGEWRTLQWKTVPAPARGVLRRGRTGYRGGSLSGSLCSHLANSRRSF